MTVQKTDERRVFRGSKVSVFEHDLVFESGEQATYELVSFDVPTGVSALPVDGDTVMLIRHYMAGVEQVELTVPSGGLEQGEDPEERMQQELMEEIGCRAGQLELIGRPLLLPGYISSEPGYLYIASDLEESHAQGDEQYVIEKQWMKLSEALSLVDKHIIQDVRAVHAVLMYARSCGRYVYG